MKDDRPWALPILDLVLAELGLLLLLGATVALTLAPPSALKNGARIAIAFAQLGLIAAFFMKLRIHRGLVRVFAGAGLAWLAIQAILTFADYATRR